MEFLESMPMHWLAFKTLWESLKDSRKLPDILRRGYGYQDGLFEHGKWDNPDFGFTADVPVALVDRVNKRFAAAHTEAKKFNPRLGYEARTALLITARLATIALFWTMNLTVFQMIAILTVQQLAICPLSLVPALAWVLTDSDFRIGHHMSFAVLGAAWYAFVPAEWADALSLTIDFNLCITYFLLDFAMCGFLLFFGKGSKNPAVVPPMKDLLISVFWGSIASRTYPFVLCALMYGTKVNFALIAIDAAIGGTFRCAQLIERLTGLSTFAIQHHAHRLNHLPHFYDQGHRTHHGLLENKMVTAFESSFAFGGIGMAEEYGPLMIDMVLHLLLGTQSNHFNVMGVMSAWFVKETHTDFANDEHGENMHLMHHLNGGIQFATPWQDILYGTAGTTSQFVSYKKRVTREKITEGVKEPVYRVTMRRQTPAEEQDRKDKFAAGKRHFL